MNVMMLSPLMTCSRICPVAFLGHLCLQVALLPSRGVCITLVMICCNEANQMNSFSSLPIIASADMLAGCTGSKILLWIPVGRLGCPSNILGSGFILNRSILQIWDDLPHQSRSQSANILGSSAWIRRCGNDHPICNSRLLHSRVHQIATSKRRDNRRVWFTIISQ